MRWIALIPLKPPGEGKQRLSGRLDPASRARIGLAMFRHVVAEIGAVAKIETIIILSQTVPEGWGGGWVKDRGGGLNAELEDARRFLGRGPLLVVHADLPLLRSADVELLLADAEATGLAIAPDRHGSGTNALALADERPFAFQFGTGSFAAHRAQAGARCRVLTRQGLALDVDTPDDLDAAIRCGSEMRQHLAFEQMQAFPGYGRIEAGDQGLEGHGPVAPGQLQALGRR
jgi:2-phospho-L-lactate guanylyltransferase